MTAIESCQSSSVTSCVCGPTRLMPALLTTMSTRPKSRATASKVASTSAPSRHVRRVRARLHPDPASSAAAWSAEAGSISATAIAAPLRWRAPRRCRGRAPCLRRSRWPPGPQALPCAPSPPCDEQTVDRRHSIAPLPARSSVVPTPLKDNRFPALERTSGRLTMASSTSPFFVESILCVDVQTKRGCSNEASRQPRPSARPIGSPSSGRLTDSSACAPGWTTAGRRLQSWSSAPTTSTTSAATGATTAAPPRSSSAADGERTLVVMRDEVPVAERLGRGRRRPSATASAASGSSWIPLPILAEPWPRYRRSPARAGSASPTVLGR